MSAACYGTNYRNLSTTERDGVFTQAVTDWFGKDVSTTLSASDAIAKGCAMQAARHAHTSRARVTRTRHARADGATQATRAPSSPTHRGRAIHTCPFLRPASPRAAWPLLVLEGKEGIPL